MAKRSSSLRRALRAAAVVVAIVAAAALAVRFRYGGGERFPDRIGEPELPGTDLELVAELAYPPGNIAVSATGRVFFTFHPDASPTLKVAEWVDGRAAPFPDAAWQAERDEGLWFDTPLSLRIDHLGRLWVLDLARHGLGDAKLMAFDIGSRELIRDHHFTRDQAGLGSHLNDFQVHPDGQRVYIAEASIFAKTPALIVYDAREPSVRRVLESDRSVMPEPYYITVDGEPIDAFGLFAVRPGVDSIALDRKGEWLYFGAVTATKMFRVRVSDLEDASLLPDELSRRVEEFGDKTESDGISSDDQGTIYLTDPEHDAITRMTADGSLSTLIRDPRLRWPDGLSFGPDGWLYVTCSALQHVIMKSPEHVTAHAPYHIFRFKPGTTAAAGH